MRGERRRYFRLEASLTPEWVRRVDSRGHILGTIDARIADVSGGGVRLEVTAPFLGVGQRVALRFPLGEDVFELMGHVAWEDAEARAGVQLVGVGFDELDPKQRRSIVASMNEHRQRYERVQSRSAVRLR